jgi:hypothetical protein
VEFIDDGLVNVQVNVVDIGVDGSVNVIVADLPLPGKTDGGFPPIGCRLKVGRLGRRHEG